MSNTMQLFDPKQNAVPAYLQDDAWGSNTTAPVTVPSLLYTGKVWTVSVNGEKTRLMTRNQDGDEVPVAVMRVILLDFAAKRGRSYYEGAYDPNATAAPNCWSDDGEKPAQAVTIPQSKTCATCQWAVKGSKVTEQGKDTTACSQHRMLALVPAFKPDMEPMRLKIAITSDWDKSPELAQQNYFAFQQYQNFLNARGVNHTAKVITKMRFDPSVAYPKVIFSPDRWLNAEEVAIVRPRLGTEAVTRLLGETITPDGADGTTVADNAPITHAPPVQQPQRAPVQQSPAARPSLADDDDGGGVILQGGSAPPAQPAPVQQPAKEAPPRQARAPRQAPAPVQQAASTALPGWDDETPAAQAPAPAQRGAAPVTLPTSTPDVPANVAAVLADWGED